jgi:hypothetical protein
MEPGLPGDGIGEEAAEDWQVEARQMWEEPRFQLAALAAERVDSERLGRAEISGMREWTCVCAADDESRLHEAQQQGYG